LAVAPARRAVPTSAAHPSHAEPAPALTWAELERFIPAAGHNPLAREMVHQGARLIRARPELVAELVRSYFEHRASSQARGFAADLLASAGTAEAQAGLREIYGRIEASEIKERVFIIQSMSVLQRPTEATVELVLAEADDVEATDVRHTAILVAGALAGAHPAREEEVLGALDAKWAREAGQSDPDHDELAQVASAYGNLGRASVFERLEPALRHESPRVRRSAAYALRKLRSKQSRDRLLELTSDPDRYVRSSVYRALAKRPDADAEVSESVLDSLFERGLPDDGRASALHLIMRNDSPALREKVKTLLDTAGLRPEERERITKTLLQRGISL
jgi:hypothetical protein